MSHLLLALSSLAASEVLPFSPVTAPTPEAATGSNGSSCEGVLLRWSGGSLVLNPSGLPGPSPSMVCVNCSLFERSIVLGRFLSVPPPASMSITTFWLASACLSPALPSGCCCCLWEPNSDGHPDQTGDSSLSSANDWSSGLPLLDWCVSCRWWSLKEIKCYIKYWPQKWEFGTGIPNQMILRA